MAAMQIDGGSLLGAQIDGVVVAGSAGAGGGGGGKGLAAGLAAPFESIAPVTVDEVRVHRSCRRQKRGQKRDQRRARESESERKITIERELAASGKKNERLSRGAAFAREGPKRGDEPLFFERKSFFFFAPILSFVFDRLSATRKKKKGRRRRRETHLLTFLF